VSSVLLAELQQLVSAHGYWVVALIVGLESMGLPLPGETILVLAAIYAATEPSFNVGVVIAVAAFGAIVGDNAGYWLGLRYDYALLLRYVILMTAIPLLSTDAVAQDAVAQPDRLDALFNHPAETGATFACARQGRDQDEVRRWEARGPGTELHVARSSRVRPRARDAAGQNGPAAAAEGPLPGLFRTSNE
jgi:hypothetical protein